MRVAHEKTSSEQTASKEMPETMTAKRALIRNARRAVRCLGLAAILLGLCAAPALAAPEFDVQLESDPLANEIQEVTVAATAGQYRLNFGEGGPGISQTTDIDFDAAPAEVADALNAIDNISTEGGSVSVVGGPGDELGTSPYLVTFDSGPLRIANVEEMSTSQGSTPLSGGSSDASVRTTQVGGVSRSDKRLDYTVHVANSASSNPIVGETLTCDTGGATWFQEPSFTFEWTSNGAPATGPTDEPTATTSTYVVQSADEGHLVQCFVKGTNAGGAALSFSNPIIVAPVPTDPPEFGASANRPTIQNEGTIQTGERVCSPPTGWSGVDPSDWQFKWLRNGELIAGATSDSYVPVPGADPGENDHLVNLQCQVMGSNTNGAGIATSGNSNTGTRAEFEAAPPAGFGQHVPNNNSEDRPSVTGGNATSGLVTLEVELPPGQLTSVLKASGSGWACVPQAPAGSVPAKVVCTRSDSLQAQSAYPSLTVAIALGTDAPSEAQLEASVSGGGASIAEAGDTFLIGPPRPFEIIAFETRVPDPLGNEETQAGSHPISARASFDFSQNRTVQDKESSPGVVNHLRPIEHVKHLNTHTPRGFVGNALAVPELCPFASMTLAKPTECPRTSVVGGITLRLAGGTLNDTPIYAIEPEFGLPAQFAFPEPTINGVYTFYPELRADDGYAISVISAPVPSNPALRGATATLCGFGAKTNPPGDGRTEFQGCKQPGEADPDGAGPLSGANPTPLVTLPTRCDSGPPITELEIDSWQNPGDFKTREFAAPVPTGCEKIRFEPKADVAPTSTEADSPTGLEVELQMPTNGVEGKDDEGNLDPEALSQANMKLSRITFPEGMAINPSAGHGLTGCSLAQVKLGTNQPHSCPNSSKVGEIAIETPLIRETLTGGVYIGKQSEAPGNSLIGLFLIFESKKDGIIIKVPGEINPDPETGQLVSTFDEIAEAPFSRATVDFAQGPRAALLTPARCGTYEIEAELVPWTAKDLDDPNPSEIVTDTTSFKVTSGPDNTPCPKDPLLPVLRSGSTNPVAGQTSPFVMRLQRPDGSDRFTALTLRPPAGLTAYLKDVPLCPEALIAKAQGREEPGKGQAELNDPSCPAASQVGRVIAGAGAGPNPFYVDTGKAYLAGPYKGAPLSILTIVPAVAGPLDLGAAVVRNAVHIDPKTAEIRVVSDPIPHILHGVLLNVRDLRVVIDRPGFASNPTDCSTKRVSADVRGLVETAISQPANPFQVGNCAALGFKPRTKLQLFGGVKRGKYQGVRAVVRPRPGDANISRTAVRFPRSAFVAQENIRTVCTRVQFAADACPQGSVYGRAVAWSPLLDYPLRGNVYLRSSDNTLPDAVADLRGPAHQPIKIEVAIRNDAVKGALRNTVQAVPDAPVSYFRLQMFGGKKGLIVNSRNICRGKNQAAVGMRAHNGRRSTERVDVFNKRCKALKRKQRAKRGKAKRRAARLGKASALDR